MATKKTTATSRKTVATKRAATARKVTAATPVATRRQVLSLLRKGVAQITFRKEDGTNRVLYGTLNRDNVPGTLTDTERNGGDVRGVVVVWDVENYGFRSFRLDRLRKIAPRK